jgi:hypothetical protein
MIAIEVWTTSRVVEFKDHQAMLGVEHSASGDRWTALSAAAWFTMNNSLRAGSEPSAW